MMFHTIFMTHNMSKYAYNIYAWINSPPLRVHMRDGLVNVIKLHRNTQMSESLVLVQVSFAFLT